MSTQSALNQVSWSRYFYSVLFEKIFRIRESQAGGWVFWLGHMCLSECRLKSTSKIESIGSITGAFFMPGVDCNTREGGEVGFSYLD